jgi:2-oxoisovalerate dehydrogenase E1 component alpha subunit
MTLLLGQTPRGQFLSLLGRKEDPNSGGRQMPGHYSERELNIVTSSAPVGVQYPQATGTALAFKMRGEDGVVMACGGEASTSGGDWHEAMNFAGIHDLPLVFLIENNVYSISTPAPAQVAGSIAKRAEGFGFPGYEVDGNDVLSVYEIAREAVERARRGDGPTLIEAKTYRMTGPLLRRRRPALPRARGDRGLAPEGPHRPLRELPLDNGILDEEQRDEIDGRIKAEVAEASEYAENAPFAEPESVLSGVYAEG